MKMIISPAKKMNVDPDSLPWQNLPDFLDQTQQLYQVLRGLSYEALKKVWKCNDQLAKLNVERLQQMDLRKNLTPAILSYEGIQYRYMAPGVFTEEQLAYVQEHLRILSGFYGLLRPFDGVTPYRLEMQAKLPVGEKKDVYAFWGDRIAQALLAQTDCIVNLASKEYSVCISRYLPPSVRFITCVFGEKKTGRFWKKPPCARWPGARWFAIWRSMRSWSRKKMRSFDRMQFTFSPEHSDETTYVFIKRAKA